MGLPITPDVVRGAYKFLCATEPFVRWNLPDADDVVFKVARTTKTAGWYKYEKRKHYLTISSGCHAHTSSLLETVAHEMIHVYEKSSSWGREDVEHSKAFKKIAERVCKYHGFDPRAF